MDLDLSVFSRDYAEARDKFLSAAADAGAAVRRWPNPNSGPRGEALSCDTAWLGPADARRVLVVISGTHGAEGFCGSGPQIAVLRGALGGAIGAETGVLLIHGINPHGWAWLRRVTEENVDLNRNWVDFGQPLPRNPGYDELHRHYVPESLDPQRSEAADAAIAGYAAVHGTHAERVARSSGQYTHPDGIFYGGDGPTWSRRTSEAILAAHLGAARTVAIVDMHTGLGPYGYGEPICNHEPGGPRVARARRWWGDSVTEPLLGTSSSQEKWGLTEFGYERALAHAAIAFVALEFGTYPPERGAAVLRADHWLHRYGDPAGPAAAPIKTALRDHFYPPFDDWKEMVLFRSLQVYRQALRGLHHEGNEGTER
jgi:hypothetical protein